MPFQIQLAGANSNRIEFPAIFANTLDGSSNGDWSLEMTVFFDNTTAIQRLMGGNLTSDASNRIYYSGNGSNLTFQKSSQTCNWTSLTNLTQNDFNVLRFEVGTTDTFPRLFVNGVLQTAGAQAGDFKAVPPLKLLGVNGGIYSNLHIRSFAYVDNLNASNSRVLSFNGAAGTPPISETANGANPTIQGTGHTWSSYGGDTTAPVLSSPTGASTGSTTASGSVSTDEGNGTLYYYASTNASETAATIKASGSSQAVSATGTQSVSFTGLTASTAYYAHYVHDDVASNESNVVSSTQFTTSTPALTADSVTGGTIRAGDTVTIQLSNATNATGKTLSIPQGALTPTAQDLNSISFIAPDLKTFGDKTGDYNTNITITVTDGAESDTIDFQIAPDVGDEVGAITALEGIYTDPAFTGLAVTDLYYTTTISGADFTVGAVPVLGTEQVFNLWIQDQTDGVWGTPFVVTIPASGVTIPNASRGSIEDLANHLRSTGTYNSPQTNEIVIEWLKSEGVLASQINDMLYAYLQNLGYKGALSDKMYGWKSDV